MPCTEQGEMACELGHIRQGLRDHDKDFRFHYRSTGDSLRGLVKGDMVGSVWRRLGEGDRRHLTRDTSQSDP